MKFTRCDVNIHDSMMVSELIYQTEPYIFSLFFGKNKEKAMGRINRLVQTENNSFSHDVIYLAIEDDEIIGLTVFYTGQDIDEKKEYHIFSQILGPFVMMRLWFYDKILFGRLLTTKLNDSDLYISNICVDKHHRGKGVGRFLLQNVLNIANRHQINRILLDVSTDNTIARNLYEKNGFHVNRVNTSVFWGITIYQMMNITHLPPSDLS